jgi:nitrogen PTS system EIIA component
VTEISAARLNLDRVLLGLSARGLHDAFESIARQLADEVRVPFPATLQALREREMTLSTAWGGGVAVPHARLAGLTRSYVVFVRLASPIEFGAPDGCPVDLLVVVLSPIEEPAEHVRLLARLARRLREPSIVARLRSSRDESEIRGAFE